MSIYNGFIISSTFYRKSSQAVKHEIPMKNKTLYLQHRGNISILAFMDKKAFMHIDSLPFIVLWPQNLTVPQIWSSTTPAQHFPCISMQNYSVNQSKAFKSWFYFLPSHSSERVAIGGGSGAHPGKRDERALWCRASVWSSVSRTALHSCIFQLQEIRVHSPVAAYNASACWYAELTV